MKLLEDEYYIDYDVLNDACKDCHDDNPDMCSEASLLFKSFLLKKRFEKEYILTPKEVIVKIKEGDYKKTYEKKILLNDSLVIDCTSFNSSEASMNDLVAVLECANLRATDSIGKVKIVTTGKNLDVYNTLVEKLELPLKVVSVEDALKELDQIHNHFMEQKD